MSILAQSLAPQVASDLMMHDRSIATRQSALARQRLFALQRQESLQVALAEEFEEIRVVSPAFARAFQAEADASFARRGADHPPPRAPARAAGPRFWPLFGAPAS